MSGTRRLPAILESVGVARVYGIGPVAVHALQDVSLAVVPGERVAITGPSGCGKTTLLHLLGGLDRSTGGEVRFDGVPFARGRTAAAAQRRHLGFIFQSFGLLPALTARENVDIGALDQFATGGISVEILDPRGRIRTRSTNLGATVLPLPASVTVLRRGPSRVTAEVAGGAMRLYSSPAVQGGGYRAWCW